MFDDFRSVRRGDKEIGNEAELARNLALERRRRDREVCIGHPRTLIRLRPSILICASSDDKSIGNGEGWADYEGRAAKTNHSASQSVAQGGRLPHNTGVFAVATRSTSLYPVRWRVMSQVRSVASSVRRRVWLCPRNLTFACAAISDAIGQKRTIVRPSD